MVINGGGGMASYGKRVELERGNRVYRAHCAEWVFLGQAFEGGRAWEEACLLYRYLSESVVQLQERLRQTPMENHCRSVVSTYSGFLWRVPPKRSFGRLERCVALNVLNVNADKDGCDLNEFMKSVQQWSSVFGVVWVVMDKPAVAALTKADEIGRDIRPYLRLYFPVNVLDWRFEERIEGGSELVYLKVRERVDGADGEAWVYRIWTKERVEVWRVEGLDEPVLVGDWVNGIGVVPAVAHYNAKPLERGVAASDLQDVARMQKSIYNDLSELHQMIRGSNHKTLVKNRNDDASTGAGGVIIMDEDTAPEKRPYLLQADADALLGLLDAMDRKAEMINRMAHLTPVRSYRSQVASGVAIETEFQILNTLLAGKAALLQATELRLFALFCLWEGLDFASSELVVTYPLRFELRDRNADLLFLRSARELAAGIGSATLMVELNRQVARLVLERDDVLEVVERELDGGG